MAEWEVPQIPEWGEANRPKAVKFMALLDEQLATNTFIAGEHFSIADITLLVSVDFLKPAKITMPDEFQNLKRWHEAVSGRPSAKA